MKRKFVSNLILLLAVNLLVKPFYILGIEAEIQNQVGVEVYGSYFALISFSFLLNILLDFGITNYNTREIAQNRQLLKKHLGGIIALRIILFAFYGVVLLAVGLFMGYSQYQMGILAVLAFNQGLAAFVLYLRSNLTALHRFKADSFLSIFDRLVLISLMSILLWGNVTDEPFHIEWFVYGQTIAYALTVILGFSFVLYHAKGFKFKFEPSFMIVILKKSYPYALLFFLMSFYFRTDSVMLERMHPDGAFEAGIYAMGFRFFEAANQVAFLFGTLLLPIFSRMIKNKDDVQPIVSLAFKILMSGAIVLAVACFSQPKEILSLIYIANNEMAGPVFGILMIGFVFVCCSYIFGTLLTANGSLRRLNQIALGAVVLNITLNLILIPEHGAWGCAVASCVTLGIVALVQLFISQQTFQFRITKGFKRTLLLFLSIMLILIIVANLIELQWQFKVIGLLLLGMFAAVGTGMLHFGRFMELLSKKEERK